MKIENLDNLIVKAKFGDNYAKEEIYSHFKSTVYGIANSFYLIGGNLDDLVQEGMIGLFEAIDDYDTDKGNFYGFCQMCIRRNIMSAVTKANREKNLPLLNSVDLDETYDLTDQSADPMELLVGKDLLTALREYIQMHLSDYEQDVLHYHMKGYSYIEIATITGKSAKSVDTALQRARKKLVDFKE